MPVQERSWRGVKRPLTLASKGRNASSKWSDIYESGGVSTPPCGQVFSRFVARNASRARSAFRRRSPPGRIQRCPMPQQRPPHLIGRCAAQPHPPDSPPATPLRTIARRSRPPRRPLLPRIPQPLPALSGQQPANNQGGRAPSAVAHASRPEGPTLERQPPHQ